MLKMVPFYASLLGRPLTPTTNATPSHVLLYGAIEAHSFGSKGCIASNVTLAEETGLAPATVSKALSQINAGNWVSVTLNENNHRLLITPLLDILPPLTVQKAPPFPTVNIGNSKEVTVRTKTLVNEIFQYYQDAFKAPTARLTPGRTRLLELRIKDCGVDLLRQAISNTSRSSWHQGENDSRWKANLDFIIRKPEQVERLAGLELKTESKFKRDLEERGLL